MAAPAQFYNCIYPGCNRKYKRFDNLALHNLKEHQQELPAEADVTKPKPNNNKKTKEAEYQALLLKAREEEAMRARLKAETEAQYRAEYQAAEERRLALLQEDNAAREAAKEMYAAEYRALEEARLMQLTRERELEAAKLTRLAASDNDDYLCKICFAQPAVCMPAGCKHLHFCYECLLHVLSTNAKCPSCRGDFAEIVTVYR